MTALFKGAHYLLLIAVDSNIAIWLYSFMAMNLDQAFGALSDPTRRAILARLAQGEATAGELGAPFRLSQPTISKHLNVLERAGLIEQTRDAQRRPRRLRPEAIKAVAEWAESFRALWERRLDNLERHLASTKTKDK
jgi:DNA-binding transcriptional ArsR family regulator